MAASHTIDALSQFRLTTALGPVGASVNFTQSNLMMVIAGIVILALLYFGMRPRAMVPGRLQALAEMSYEGIMSMCVDTIGPEGRQILSADLHAVLLHPARQPDGRLARTPSPSRATSR